MRTSKPQAHRRKSSWKASTNSAPRPPSPARWFLSGGLHHTSKGASIKIRGGKIIVTDGPFSEAKEVIGGFTILNLASKEEAIEEARKFMDPHARYWPAWKGDCEVRLMYDDGAGPEV